VLLGSCDQCRPMNRQKILFEFNPSLGGGQTSTDIITDQWIDETNNRMDNSGDSASEDEDENGSGARDHDNSSPNDTPMGNNVPLPSPISSSVISPHQRELTNSPWQTNFSGTPEAAFNTPPYGPVEPYVSHTIHHVFLPADIPPPRELFRCEYFYGPSGKSALADRPCSRNKSSAFPPY